MTEEQKIRAAERRAARRAMQEARAAEEKKDRAIVLEVVRDALKDKEATTAQRLFAVAVLDHIQHYYFVPSDTRHLLQTADAAKIDAEIAERLEQLKNK